MTSKERNTIMEGNGDGVEEPRVVISISFEPDFQTENRWIFTVEYLDKDTRDKIDEICVRPNYEGLDRARLVATESAYIHLLRSGYKWGGTHSRCIPVIKNY
ncbi:hypothetical protein [Paenalkalicoccus suaedae]|uniref:hypothetical protein n=1 Tax=Paenalkalicoccus suaedae TaxID=2592382 RepID=UPI00158E4B00|nr:hypothetical protein [Paenalkalicoccus suaedae]